MLWSLDGRKVVVEEHNLKQLKQRMANMAVPCLNGRRAVAVNGEGSRTRKLEVRSRLMPLQSH